MYGSEIEMAIKIGDLIFSNKFHKDSMTSDELLTLAKLAILDVEVWTMPKSNHQLSNTLRVLTEHRGDKSFVQFFKENLESKYQLREIIFFLRGIFYLYPIGSSMELCMKESGLIDKYPQFIVSLYKLEPILEQEYLRIKDNIFS